MKPTDCEMSNPWLGLLLDSKYLAEARSTAREKLAWESFEGSLNMKMSWTTDAETSHYAPHQGTLRVDHVVVSAVMDELIATCKQLRRTRSAASQIVLHGTSLELAMKARGATVEISLLEYVDYSERERKLGVLTLTRDMFFTTVARFVDDFLDQLVLTIRSLSDHKAVLYLRKEAETLAKSGHLRQEHSG